MGRRAGHRRWVVAIGLAMVGVVGAMAPAPAAAAWRVVPGPNTSPCENFLTATAPVPGTSQLWAVGYTLDGPALGTNHSLIEHTHGSRWSVVPSPDPNGESHLAGVAASSPSAAWAAGWTTDGALIDRWNGTRWSRVALPAAARGASLFGVRAFSTTDALAVGAIGTATGEQAVSLHWNGTAWSLQRAPVPSGCTDAGFWAVAAQSIPPVSVGQDGVGMSGVAAASPTKVVAVGFHVPV